ncbi:MAG TPA: ferritin family protein [Myxococcales bacterium]|jgi:rubrerythrin
MDAKTHELVAGLRAAMQGERTGYEFYKMAAAHTKDPEGKKTFEALAAEEQSHFDFLRKHYLSLHETGQLSKDARLGKAHELAGEHPIFSADLKSRIKGAHFEMSALAIAAQLELNGINHYREQAARAQSPEARKLFQDLVEWESGHYEAFIRQQQELQEAYWGEAGFSPF